jgi:small subunit ribosomal protein S6
MVVFDGTLPEEVVLKEQKQIEDYLTQSAEFDHTEMMGKKPLAYSIKKKKSGYYCLFFYVGTGENVAAFDKSFKLNDNVLRHLTVVRNLKNDVARAAAAVRKTENYRDPSADGRDY